MLVAKWKGLGVAKDEEKALRWLENAANSGNLLAQGIIGVHALSMGNAPKAVYYWEKAQAGGSSKASLELANLYLDGADGVPMNKARAIALYRKVADEGVAEGGDASAQKNLAIFYRNGRGTPVNKFLAILWFEKHLTKESFRQNRV